MALSAAQLEETHKRWSADIIKKINTFDQGGPETLRLHIEAEKVSMLYEIAMQLALMEQRK